MKEIYWMLRFVKRSLRSQFRLWSRDLKAWQRFWRSYRCYTKLVSTDSSTLLEHLYPCLGDDLRETPIEPIYFYQDAWAFDNIVKQSPSFHVDVGSHHKFVALLSKVLPVVFVDIRPMSLSMDTIEYKAGSILDLPFDSDSVPSVSSLCVVEHIGLGRYGDPLDPDGSEKAVKELCRIVQPNGNLYISFPILESNRTYFNAHRAFQEEYILSLTDSFKIVENRYIYGKEFCWTRKSGFGIGCYHLQKSKVVYEYSNS